MSKISFASSSWCRRNFVGYHPAVILLVLFLPLTACQSTEENNSDIQLNWKIEPTPPQTGEATITLTLRDSTNKLIEGANITLEGNMSHPGMKPILTRAKETEPGRYTAQMEFTMGGDWFILVNATLPDERVVERQIDITGVRSE